MQSSDGVFATPHLSPSDGPSVPNTQEVAMEVPGPAVLEQHAGAICGDKIAGIYIYLSITIEYTTADHIKGSHGVRYFNYFCFILIWIRLVFKM